MLGFNLLLKWMVDSVSNITGCVAVDVPSQGWQSPNVFASASRFPFARTLNMTFIHTDVLTSILNYM